MAVFLDYIWIVRKGAWNVLIRTEQTETEKVRI